MLSQNLPRGVMWKGGVDYERLPESTLAEILEVPQNLPGYKMKEGYTFSVYTSNPL